MSRDFCENKQYCLTKAILICLSEEKTSESGFKLYQKYLKSFVLTEPDTNLVSHQRRPQLEYEAICLYYKNKNLEDPAFFNFFNFQCLTRLSKMIDLNIVIYLKTTQKQILLFRDFRNVCEKSKTIFLVLTENQELFLSGNLDLELQINLPFAEVGQFKNDNWIHSISKMCELENINDFCVTSHQELKQQSQEIYKRIQKNILIVTFCSYKRLFAQKSKKSTFSGKNIFFNIVGSICKQNFQLKSINDFDYIVCMYRTSFYFLLADVKKILLLSLISPTNLDKLSDMNYQKLPHLSKNEILSLKNQHKLKKKSRKSDNIEKLCKCSICVSKEFDENMSKAGPEQLDIVELHISNLLEILNLNCTSNCYIIEQLCELSVASFDIESITVDSDHLETDEFFPVNEIDQRGTEAYTHKLQKPIMISHCDVLSIEEHLDLTITSQSDKEEDIYEMMITYWNIVCKQQEKCVAVKKKIAQPLIKTIKEYAAVFFNLCGNIGNENGEMEEGNWESAWKNTLFGKLDVALSKLIDKYIVFSFYG